MWNLPSLLPRWDVLSKLVWAECVETYRKTSLYFVLIHRGDSPQFISFYWLHWILVDGYVKPKTCRNPLSSLALQPFVCLALSRSVLQSSRSCAFFFQLTTPKFLKTSAHPSTSFLVYLSSFSFPVLQSLFFYNSVPLLITCPVHLSLFILILLIVSASLNKLYHS
jgi:hypothetical protein